MAQRAPPLLSWVVRGLNEDSMAQDVTFVLKRLLAANRGLDPTDPERRQSPDYGVAASLEADVLDVKLTFKKDRFYCCGEWSCHLGLPYTKRWNRLRQALADAGVLTPSHLRLHLSCTIEEGAFFFDFSKPDPSRRGWYAFAPVASHEYKVVEVEAGSD